MLTANQCTCEHPVCEGWEKPLADTTCDQCGLSLGPRIAAGEVVYRISSDNDYRGYWCRLGDVIAGIVTGE